MEFFSKNYAVQKEPDGNECIWFHLCEILENIKIIYNYQKQTSGCLRLRMSGRKTTFWKLKCKPALALAHHILTLRNLNLRKWYCDSRVVEKSVMPVMICWQHVSPAKSCQINTVFGSFYSMPLVCQHCPQSLCFLHISWAWFLSLPTEGTAFLPINLLSAKVT